MEGYLLRDLATPARGHRAGADSSDGRRVSRQWSPAWDLRLDTLGWTRHPGAGRWRRSWKGGSTTRRAPGDRGGLHQSAVTVHAAAGGSGTVQYAVSLEPDSASTRLYFRDYETNSPYNTYLHPGCRPGPVNSPGLAAAIRAALSRQVPYLFFVARPDGCRLRPNHSPAASIRGHSRSAETKIGTRNSELGTPQSSVLSPSARSLIPIAPPPQRPRAKNPRHHGHTSASSLQHRSHVFQASRLQWQYEAALRPERRFAETRRCPRGMDPHRVW